MSAASATPAAKPPPVTGTLDEFSDKLSPMLVKELRQGLRAKTFVILFLALQGLLAVVLLVVASASDDSGMTVSKVIFFFFSLAALVAQPLRGIGALHNEIKGNTIDLMVLTRLDAWRIVLGKWVAIVSQTALLLTAIAPYLILRYFFGRMNLFAELLLLALIFLGSALFTALTVGLSAVPSILVRGLLPMFFGMYLGGGIIAITFDRNDFSDLIGFCSLQEDHAGWAVLIGVLGSAYLGWSALALGASMIAPMAENHSTIRRLVAIGTVLLFWLLAVLSELPPEGIAVILVLTSLPAAAIALTEPLQLLPPICRPFVRFGGWGKLAGRFFYPGWPSGVLFTGLLAALGIGIMASTRIPSLATGTRSMPTEMVVVLLAGLGTVFLPALLLRIFARKAKQAFAVYLLIMVILVAITIALAMIADETEHDSFVWWFCWVPPVQTLLMDVIQRDFYENTRSTVGVTGSPNLNPLVVTGIVTSAVYYISLLACAVKSFPAIREVEDEVVPKPAVDP